MKRVWRQDRETGKLIEVTSQRAVNSGHYVRRDIEPFVSNVDGSVISGAKGLREHNKRNGVHNDMDFIREQTARANEPKVLSSHERKGMIADAIERTSSSGFSRRINYQD